MPWARSKSNRAQRVLSGTDMTLSLNHKEVIDTGSFGKGRFGQESRHKGLVAGMRWTQEPHRGHS